MSVELVREKCSAWVKGDPAELDEFWSNNRYVAGSYDKREDLEALQAEMSGCEEGGGSNRLFYLALPPSVFKTISAMVSAVCMSTTGWNR